MGNKDLLVARVTFKVRVTCDEGSILDARDEVEELIGAAMEELLADERIADPLITTDYSTGDVDFELIVAGESAGNVVDIAGWAVRSAIHGAGGSTPNWPAPELDDHEVVVTDIDVDHEEARAIFTRLGFNADLIDA